MGSEMCIRDRIYIVMAYLFLASVMPMWLLMQPRDYMTTFMLLGMIVGAVLGVLVAHPSMQLNAFNGFNVGGNYLFPTLFVTIACGAVSGFHSLVSSGTSSKTVENEKDMEKALEDVNKAECNALVVFLGNFGPETPETLIAERFDGPCMYVAAAEGDGDMINGRGDAYCGMLNCSYNLKMRHLKAYIPEYPVGTADDIAKMIADFVPVARAVIGVSNLKIITFGPRPQDFFCLLYTSDAADD